MEIIKLSQIPNLCNMVVTKSGELCSGIRILMSVKGLFKGRKPMYYYQGKKVVIDINKDDIEEVIVCDCCGWQSTDLTQECPQHSKEVCQWSYRIRGTQHQVYEDNFWLKFKQDFKDGFIYLDRFNK